VVPPSISSDSRKPLDAWKAYRRNDERTKSNKVFCREEEVKKDFDKLNEALFDDARKANRYANILAPILNNIGNVLYVLLPLPAVFYWLQTRRM